MLAHADAAPTTARATRPAAPALRPEAVRPRSPGALWHALALSPAATPGRRLQRRCACNAAGQPCAACVARSAAAGEASAPREFPQPVERVLARPGRPLDVGLREHFEPRFGRGFGDVRVHTDGEAAESARTVHAQAYTVGRDVVFAAGQYRPESGDGRRLLAHELAHVAQQSDGRAAAPAGTAQFSQPGDALEVAAERTAAQVMQSDGRTPVAGAQAHAPAPSAARTLARQPPPATTPTATPACGTQTRPITDLSRMASTRGEVEHALVQIDFMGTPGRTPRAEYSIPGASKSGSGNTGYADAVDLATKEVFEIKPEHLSAQAQTEAAGYATAASAQCGGTWKPGASYKPNRNPIWELKSGSTYVRLVASFGGSGAILYKWEWGGLKMKLSDEWVKFWARQTAFAAVFGRTIQTLEGVNAEDVKLGQGDAPGLKPLAALRMAKPVVSTFNAALQGSTEFMKGIAYDLGQLGTAIEGTRYLVLMPETAFAASAAGLAVVAQQIGQMQVKVDPTVQLFRDTLGVIFAGMAAGYAIGITGAVAFAYGGAVVGGLAALEKAAEGVVTTAGAAARAISAWAKLAQAGAATAGATMVLGVPSTAGAEPSMEVARMRYQPVPGVSSAGSLPTSVDVGGVKHIVVGVAQV